MAVGLAAQPSARRAEGAALRIFRRIVSGRGTAFGPSLSRLRPFAALLLLATAGAPAVAQYPTRPFLDWRTVETEHFSFHFPRELEEWTLSVASRMESVRSAVGSVVGNLPRRKVHVVVDDPYNVPNGFAIPPLDWPVMVLWTTPPSPRQEVGHFRSWGEILSVHEFAHVAHLTWPSRNPFQRGLWRLLPADLGPVLRRAPRWAIEGYATYVEGRITGSGRPYGVWRPAVLRQWALEGLLPTYGQLNASNAYEGGAFAYLAGSAYLEWLTRREGDSSLVYLWRRLSARTNRSFAAAFSGLYGDTPEALYGRFAAELTGKALEAERLIKESGGVVAGSIVQRLAWETGDPAISRDGRHVAVVLRADRRPARLVVWRTGPDSVTPRARRRGPARRAPRRDTLDVPDRRFYPPPKRAVATLTSIDGRAYDEPRFFADGERVLLSRLEPRGDGTLVYDLSVWNFKRRSLHRITHAAGVHAADPAPDGRTAAATRCARGLCDLVLVDLASGAVRTLLSGMAGVAYYRPRYSPDGHQLAVSVQQDGRWRVGIVELAGRALRFVGPADSAARYDVAWLPGGRALVQVSERGGIPNLESVDAESGASHTLTRVTGAALAPEPNPTDGSIWFLSLHARGLDLRRFVRDSSRVAEALVVPERLAPAAPTRVPTADTMRTNAVRASRPYGIGPRQARWFPGFSYSADGVAGEFVVNNSDPVGRLALRVAGAIGDRATWRGGALAATWRRRVAVTGTAYVAQQEPSRRFMGVSGPDLDVRMSGADLAVELRQEYWSVRHAYRVGAALAAIDPVASLGPTSLEQRSRSLGYAEVVASYRQRYGEVRLSQAFSLHSDAGANGPARFVRGLVAGAFAAAGALPFGGIEGSITYGEAAKTDDAFERFTVGGPAPPLMDNGVLAQRIAMPALPTGVASGDRLLAFRVALPSGPLSPYYFGASAAERGTPFERWHRVVGAELRVGSESIPLVALPDVQLMAGYGRSLDAPYRRGSRIYATLIYRR